MLLNHGIKTAIHFSLGPVAYLNNIWVKAGIHRTTNQGMSPGEKLGLADLSNPQDKP
ncbi:hypothetical protein [Parasedimentitalea psychrophila]|uniref:Uncharacterized protein n=1 Tax=Parasedimentitalea psychrophila TaxID=2997337 RepID=A0A9Y2L4A0_9RHOB|nr:hypothetical protein [Parasedimentitalea psychrophila]WIY27411.1 hypothetical protein QPJ95_11135 [Parasedimentitalea psychrophila]